MNDQNEHFPPESVDEQVEQLLKRQNIHRIHHYSPADERVVRDLSHLYQADACSLNDVWEQLTAYAAEKTRESQGRTETVEKRRRLQQERDQAMRQEEIPAPRIYINRWFGLLASVLVAAILVSSMLWMFNLLPLPGNGIGASNTTVIDPDKRIQGNAGTNPLGVYVSGTASIYRLDVKSGKILWTYKPKANGRDFQAVWNATVFNPPLLVKGVVYGRTGQGDLQAINANTGKAIWIRSFNTLKFNGPYVVDNTLYMDEIRSSEIIVHEVTPKDGSLVKRFSVKAKEGTFGSDVTDTLLFNGVFYVTKDALLYAFQAGSGKQLWQVQIDEGLRFDNSGLLINNGIVYSAIITETFKSGIFDVYIAAFDVRTGKKLWQSTAINDHMLNKPVISNGILYCGSQDGSVYAFDANSGKLLQRYDMGGPVYPTPVVMDGIMYVGHGSYEERGVMSGGIRALKIEDKSLVWQKDVPYNGDKPLVVQDGIVYANGMDLYALDAADGTVLWTFKPTKAVWDDSGPTELAVTVIS